MHKCEKLEFGLILSCYNVFLQFIVFLAVSFA